MHSGIQGSPDIPAFPCAVVWRLMARSPRGALHYCPRRLAADRCAYPVGPLHHRKPWRTDPGRQDHTLLPYADRTGRVRASQPLTGKPALQLPARRCTPRPPPPGPRIV